MADRTVRSASSAIPLSAKPVEPKLTSPPKAEAKREIARDANRVNAAGYVDPHGSDSLASRVEAAKHAAEQQHKRAGQGVGDKPGGAVDDLATAVNLRRASNGVKFGSKGEGDPFVTVERTALPINSSTPERDAVIAKLLVVHSVQEADNVSRLSEVQQYQYQQVASFLSDKPAGRFALQELLSQDKLTKGPTASDGMSLLDYLFIQVAEPLASGIDRKELVSDTVQEIANPMAIEQGERGTCTVSALQVLVASTHPAEYARILAGLANENKSVTLADGKTTITPNESALRGDKLKGTDDQGNFVKDAEGQDEMYDDDRPLTTRLWAPALMELGNGSATYDNVTDHHSNGRDGLDIDEVAGVVHALTATTPTLIEVDEAPDAKTKAAVRERAMTLIQQRADAGKLTPVSLDYRDDNTKSETDADFCRHEVLVTKVDRKKERVYLNDTANRSLESMPIKDFKRRLFAVNAPAVQSGY